MVLILTHSADFYVPELLASQLKQLGFESLRINTDDFPSHFQLTYQKNGALESSLTINNKTLNLSQVKGVILRKYWGPKAADNVSPQFRAACRNESQACLEGVINLLSQTVPFIDSLALIKNASNKITQLQVAASLGIKIPNTMVTNNPEHLSSFYHSHKGRIVTKMMTALSSSMSGSSFFVSTNKVLPEHLESASLLEHCPMIFQEEIDKAYELRVIYVGGKFFVGKIQANTPYATDSRLLQKEQFEWVHYQLPQLVEEQLNRLMLHFNLQFGAIDIIRDTNKRYLFLEVNPTGEWGMLEKDLNLPISEAIANLLVSKISNR